MIDALFVPSLTQGVGGVQTISNTIEDIQLSRAILFIQIILEDVRGVAEERYYIGADDGMNAGDVVVDDLFFEKLGGCDVSIEKVVVGRNFIVVVFIKEIFEGESFKLPVLAQRKNVFQGLVDRAD